MEALWTQVKEEAVQFLAERRQQMVDWVLKFLQIPTMNPPGENYTKFAELCRELFRQLEIPYDCLEVPESVVKEQAPYAKGEKRLIILSSIGNKEKGPELHFNGHYDVVPAGDGWKWSSPFEPKIENGIVYGRGAADMKSALVAMTFAVAALKPYEDKLPGRISLSFVPDEEMGGATGTGYLIRSNLVRPSFCIVGEPTGISNIWIAHKGRIEGRITVSGIQAHGSVPYKGKNAFMRAVKLMAWLDRHYGELLNARTSKYETDPGAEHPSILWGGVASGGSKATIVPGKFEVTFDRRILPEEDADDVLSELLQLIYRGAEETGIPEGDIRAEGRVIRYPCIGGIAERETAAFVNTAKFLKHQPPRFILGPGGTDLTHFTENGVRGVVAGPGTWEQAHTQDEHIRLDEIWDASEFYAIFAVHYLSAV